MALEVGLESIPFGRILIHEGVLLLFSISTADRSIKQPAADFHHSFASSFPDALR